MGIKKRDKASVYDLEHKEEKSGQQKNVLLHPVLTFLSEFSSLIKKIHRPVGTWDGKEHLLQAVGILTDRIKANQKKFPTWSVAQYLKGRPVICLEEQ